VAKDPATSTNKKEEEDMAKGKGWVGDVFFYIAWTHVTLQT